MQGSRAVYKGLKKGRVFRLALSFSSSDFLSLTDAARI